MPSPRAASAVSVHLHGAVLDVLLPYLGGIGVVLASVCREWRATIQQCHGGVVRTQLSACATSVPLFEWVMHGCAGAARELARSSTDVCRTAVASDALPLLERFELFPSVCVWGEATGFTLSTAQRDWLLVTAHSNPSSARRDTALQILACTGWVRGMRELVPASHPHPPCYVYEILIQEGRVEEALRLRAAHWPTTSSDRDAICQTMACAAASSGDTAWLAKAMEESWWPRHRHIFETAVRSADESLLAAFVAHVHPPAPWPYVHEGTPPHFIKLLGHMTSAAVPLVVLGRLARGGHNDVIASLLADGVVRDADELLWVAAREGDEECVVLALEHAHPIEYLIFATGARTRDERALVARVGSVAAQRGIALPLLADGQ